MMDLKCLKEKLPDLAYSLAFIVIGLFFTLVGFTVLPIIGFIIAVLMILLVAPELEESLNPECPLHM